MEPLFTEVLEKETLNIPFTKMMNIACQNGGMAFGGSIARG